MYSSKDFAEARRSDQASRDPDRRLQCSVQLAAFLPHKSAHAFVKLGRKTSSHCMIVAFHMDQCFSRRSCHPSQRPTHRVLWDLISSLCRLILSCSSQSTLDTADTSTALELLSKCLSALLFWFLRNYNTFLTSPDAGYCCLTVTSPVRRCEKNVGYLVALLHDEHMLRSALQSRKWQLIGMSWSTDIWATRRLGDRRLGDKFLDDHLGETG